ncbi:MAG: LPS export ABC transporter permease LptG [Herbaspirillum sp.]
MKVLDKYFMSEILRSVLFVLVAFLAIFAFFDLISELQEVGRGGYKLQHAFLFVLLGLPGYVYELMPIAVLIGTIYTLAQLAARSEFTIMRVSSMSTGMVATILFKIGILFVLFTVIFGELISPAVSSFAERTKLKEQGLPVAQEFRSGMWTKDVIREHGLSGAVIGSRFINVQQAGDAGNLTGVKIYELNQQFHLDRIITAARAEYQGNNLWSLQDAVETSFNNSGPHQEVTAVTSVHHAEQQLVSDVTPAILSVLLADPDRMSAYDLATYSRHLAENNQRTERYEIAFWKKIVYPFTVFVMMALALPFAYLHFRAGGVSLKIFTGIMIGVSFQLINSLFSHLGLLNTWPPLATAMLPALLFLSIAMFGLWWVERH